MVARPPSARHPGARPARILPLLAGFFLVAAVLRMLPAVSQALAQDPGAPASQSPSAVTAQALRPAAEGLPDAPADADLSLELRDRARQLAEREAALAEREVLLDAAQTRLADQIAALQSAEAELAATMALADQAAENDILRLVEVFAAMKPEEAAAVFTEMDPQFAAGFLGRLAPESAAAILADLDPRQAYALSAILAGRNALVPRE